MHIYLLLNSIAFVFLALTINKQTNRPKNKTKTKQKTKKQNKTVNHKSIFKNLIFLITWEAEFLQTNKSISRCVSHNIAGLRFYVLILLWFFGIVLVNRTKINIQLAFFVCNFLVFLLKSMYHIAYCRFCNSKKKMKKHNKSNTKKQTLLFPYEVQKIYFFVCMSVIQTYTQTLYYQDWNITCYSIDTWSTHVWNLTEVKNLSSKEKKVVGLE